VECYALLPANANLTPTENQPALYHYCPKFHGLERRLAMTARQYEKINTACGIKDKDAFLVVLSYVDWYVLEK